MVAARTQVVYQGYRRPTARNLPELYTIGEINWIELFFLADGYCGLVENVQVLGDRADS